jgi:hypothetical protein
MIPGMALSHLPHRSITTLLRATALVAAAILIAPAQGAHAQTEDPAVKATDPAPKTEDPTSQAQETDGPQAIPGRPQPAWIPQTRREQELLIIHGDHYVAVVGDELITRDAILREASRVEDPNANNPDLTDVERQNGIFWAALHQGIESRLKVQGGRNQGYEPEMIKAIVHRYVENQLERWGGPTEATARIAEMGMNLDEYRSHVEQRLLAQFWEDSVTGRSIGAGGRQFVDSYVRPGKLFSRYRAYARDPNPRLNALVGKKPPQLVLQRLLIDSAKLADVEKAERLAATLRDNIATGVMTFEEAYNRYADFRGDESFIRGSTDSVVELLAQYHPGVDLEGFVRGAAIDDVSQAERIDRPGTKPVFAIYKMVERIDATAATPFVDLGLQTELRTSIEDEDAKIRVARGLSVLVQTTYIAPAEIRDILLRQGQRRRR